MHHMDIRRILIATAFIGDVTLVRRAEAATAQAGSGGGMMGGSYGNGMMGGRYGNGWMSGYGGPWMLVMIVVVVGVVALVVARARQKH